MYLFIIFIKIYFLLFSFLFSFSCSHMSRNDITKQKMKNLDYFSKLKKHTYHFEDYEGLDNKLELNITFLSHNFQIIQNEILATMYQWDEDTILAKKDEINSSVEEQSKFFLSFFTPNGKNNKLEIESKSLWKIYLMIDGKKYEPRIIKEPGLYDKILTFYPYHTQWSKAYLLIFPLSSNTLERSNAKIIITGPLGYHEINIQ